MNKKLILSKIKKHLGYEKDGDFAEFLGIKQNTLSNWKSRNTIDYDLIISKCENIDANWLLTGKGEMLKRAKYGEIDDLPPSIVAEKQSQYGRKGIPLLPVEAFAGEGFDIEGINFDVIEERYEIPLFDGIQVDFMLPVRGSSMYPKYSSGDVVACRFVRELLFVQWNRVYVLDTISQGVIMKRLKKSPNEEMLICKSDNESYDPFEIPKADIRNIALVVGVIRLE